MVKRSAWAVVAVLGGICLTGCAALFPIENEMSSWKGRPIDEVIDQVGPPTYVRAVGTTKTYEWEEDLGGTYTYGGEVRLLCTRTIAVDELDRVLSWSWTGTGCNASPNGRWKRNPPSGS